MSFENLGLIKMQNEEDRFNQNHFESTTKPFTTKSPVYVIESIDALAEFMEIPRNTFVNFLIGKYLMDCFSDFSDGYHSMDAEKQSKGVRLLADMEKIISNSSLSNEAKRYLEESLNDFLVLHRESNV